MLESPKPGMRIPDRSVRYICEGGCGAAFDLEGFRNPPRDGVVQPEPDFGLNLQGHIEPAPRGCLMPMGPDWLLAWFDKPRTEADVGAEAGALQLGDRKQAFGPYALCKDCIAAGGRALLPRIAKDIFMGKSSFGSLTVFSMIEMVIRAAQEKRRQDAPHPPKGTP